MDALYWVPRKFTNPGPPDRWSYTSLKQFSNCPKRWLLANATFEELGGEKIPTVPNASQLTGRIVHGMLDGLEHFRQEFCADGDGLRSPELDELLSKFGTRKRARELLAKEKASLSKNLRCKPNRILGQISLDDCVTQFKRVVVNRYPRGPCKAVARTARAKTPDRSAKRSVGAEIELSHDNPPLIGYVDYVGEGKIVEVKTGQFAEEHLAQAKFYALLYKYQFGESPSVVSVEYASASEHSFTQQFDLKELGHGLINT
ncbi:MAG: PD-(D/E)XK nuclease family protein [Pirellulaceae bacterium]|nr:PD-(D/E)XK nuclease family protein [Pirellulaceae bacterium]